MPSLLFEAFTDGAAPSCGTTKEQLQAQITTLRNTVQDTTNPKLAYQLGQANSSYSDLQAALTVFRTEVVTPLTTLSQTVRSCTNINSVSTQLDTKLSELERLKAELDRVGPELSTAYTREAVVDTKDQAASFQETWGLIQRPIRRQSIPILIVLTLLFLTGAGLGLWYLSPYARQLADPGATSPWIWFGSLIVIILVVIYGVLAVLRLI